MLLVEDDENKRAQIMSFIRQRWPDSELLIAISFQSGMRALDASDLDVIILDMTLPNYDPGVDESGSVIHVMGGMEFLRKMKRRKIHIPVVVVTQFETFGKGPERMDLGSLRASLKSDYAGVCVGAVYYNSAIDSWKEELASLVKGCRHGNS